MPTIRELVQTAIAAFLLVLVSLPCRVSEARAQQRTRTARGECSHYAMFLVGVSSNMSEGVRRGQALFARALRDAEHGRFRRAASGFLAAARLLRVQPDAASVVGTRMVAYRNAALSLANANALAEARRQLERDAEDDPPNAAELRELLAHLPAPCGGPSDAAR